MAAITARQEGTPIDDVIGLELGPIYNVDYPGIVHIIPPIPSLDVALGSHALQQHRQQMVSNRTQERKRKQAEEVFQRVYRNGPLTSRDKSTLTPVQPPPNEAHVQRDDDMETGGGDDFRMQVLRLRYTVHKQKDEAKPEATRANYRNRQRIFMVNSLFLSPFHLVCMFVGC